MTSTINNAPDRNTRGIDQAKTCTTTAVTGALLQKPVTVDAGNQGSCDNNPGQAVTKDETGAIVGKTEAIRKEGSVDPRGDGAKSCRGIDKGKNLKSSARQGGFIS
jgi:hypothetical protein